MYTIQYIALVIIGGLMIYVFLKFRDQKLELSDLITWELFFIVLLIISLAPVRISTEIQKILGLRRGLDALFASMIGLAYLLLFKLYLDIDRIEREITELTREVGIKLKEIEDMVKRKP
ncbi:UDP-N-acetylglucosamine--dolichyl-phosphate N-acetylglucosaminephosphotransferase [Thermococcus chitonophagus]|uniref:UDP-N-acetylglucosamine--dolichyl-phosphate N-acetylglucosaminephosphotransferase n=1 Tax=Thermococcus chitonophagus TaxID=54262 RepID=A0A160VX62_9EURY|nr:DUF2304 family protein [Thermococcus chitonophagus]ASJ16406.1 UDP-N-acetylglucosamine--dolichyl-phosphate N-acetylglucosaminephosphotransferase [Thermococcus chitonophagus]CUX78601.1 hypothetical protein CHITON_1822 [Thermococcus chitonophagus]